MSSKIIQEIEFKWRIDSETEFDLFLLHAGPCGAKIGPAKQLLIRDFYIDTAELAFTRENIKCRLRLINGKWEANLKTASKLKKGLASRKEKTLMLPRVKTKSQALEKLRGLLFKNAPFAGWLFLFQIKNKRTVREFKLPLGTKAEISFDRVEISKGQEKVKMLEIEMEFVEGNLQSFKRLASRLTASTLLHPAKVSKVATAMQTFSKELPSIPTGIRKPSRRFQNVFNF